jgi:CrcB protein
VDPAAAAPRPSFAQLTILVVVGCAGAVGALVRYAVSLAIPTPTGAFPWGTLVINLTGSFAIGFVLALLRERFPRGRLARPLVVTGFLGAYTTFSTYTVDTDLLLRRHDIVTAVGYALSSLVGGVVAVVTGLVLARAASRLEHRLDEQMP